MEQSTLSVQIRNELGKGPARRLRAKGLIPAVLYRGSDNPINLTVDPKMLDKSLKTGVHTLLKLEVDGGGEPTGKVAIIKELQRDPVYDDYLHADFILVDLDKPMEIGVQLEFTGTAAGVTLGGILQPIMRQIEVRCLPADIPRHISLDVSKLNIGDALHVKDLVLPEGVKCLEDMEAPVVMVAAPAMEEKPKAAEEVEGEAAAEGAEGAAAAPGKEGDKEKKEEGKKTEKKEEGKKGEKK